MKKLSLQWRLTLITTLFIAIICGCLTMFVYGSGVYYMDSLQETVDAQNTDGDDSHQNEIYISIPDDKWDDFANDFSVQVYNNKADYKKKSLFFSIFNFTVESGFKFICSELQRHLGKTHRL